jgi:low affinity Fe/Cu permease
MSTNTNLSEAEIRALLDEYFRSGCSLNEFCTIEDHDETVVQTWIDKYYPELDDDGFSTLNVNPNLKDEIKKPSPKKQQTLFAKVGDIELYHQVPAAYLKSLKG